MDYQSKKKEELLALAREKGLQVTDKMTKAKLIELLTEKEEPVQVKQEEKHTEKEKEGKTPEKKSYPEPEKEPAQVKEERAGYFGALAQRFRERRKNRQERGSSIRPVTTENDYLRVDGSDRYKKVVSQEEQDYLELMASYDKKVQKVLTGEVTKIRGPRMLGNEKIFFADVQYNTQLIHIPGNFFLENWDELKDDEKKAILNNRLGQSASFIVTEYVETEDRGVQWIGSRVAAMQKLRDKYWFGKSRAGKDLINVGDRIEGIVNAVTRTACYIEVFGVEQPVHLGDLTYEYIRDARKHFRIGEKLTVAVTKVVRNPKTRSVYANYSVRAAMEDPQARFFEDTSVGDGLKGVAVNRAVMNDQLRVFVNIPSGGVVLCSLGKGIDRIPEDDDIVWLTVSKKSEEKLRVFGVITHVETPISK